MVNIKWRKNNAISSYKKQSIALILCMLLVLIPIIFSACQQKENESKSLLSGEQLTTIESLYDRNQSETLERLQLEESDISQGTHPGLWNLAESVSIEGKEFSESLLFDASTETFYGVRFTNRFEDAEEISGYVKDILKKANDVYGEPSTYPELQNRLAAETFSSDLLESMNSGALNDWREEWTVGEKTRCTLSVMVVETNVATISLEYIVAK